MNGSSEQSPPGLRPGPPPLSTIRVGRLGGVFALLLVLALAAVALPTRPVAALSLPWQRPLDAPHPPAVSRGLPPLQEVSPPAAVQQLQSALAGRQPVVDILSPQDDATLPPGPWTLKLRVHDWPLVDGGDLGPGPHLVVQLDQEPPRIWTRSEGTLPELSPGSHRLTVYAAQPWGEARKNPGAVRQIRLHRTAANPLSLPAPGSPQLLAVSPSGVAGEEPLLLDWLLLEAPLQDVGGSGTQWRLRVSINDDAVLLDQQTSLWLKGWRAGPNALRLELLDGRGEPLNPPFNSLVREVDVQRTEPSPRWGGPPLSAAELAILLGEAPAPPPTEASSASPAQVDASPSGSDVPIATETEAATPTPPAGPPPRPSFSGEPGALVAIPEEAAAPLLQTPPAPVPRADERQELQQAEAERSPATTTMPAGHELSPDPAGVAQANHEVEPVDLSAPKNDEQGRSSDLAVDEQAASDVNTAERAEAEAPAADAPDPVASVAGSDSDAAAPDTPQDTMTLAPASAPPPAPTPTAATPVLPVPPPESSEAERIRPSSALAGRARDLVNEDGTLRRPDQRGPLAGLREWLER